MPTDALVITIPGTPDRCLSQNARVHWGNRARATKQARNDAYYACRNANAEMWEPAPPITIYAVIAWEKGRRMCDQTNALGLLKATVDGIADAIGVDDRHITLATVQQERDEDGRGYIKVAIESAAKAVTMRGGTRG
jgi:crossover junction endodeoxyribonuclease RusA